MNFGGILKISSNYMVVDIDNKLRLIRSLDENYSVIEIEIPLFISEYLQNAPKFYSKCHKLEAFIADDDWYMNHSLALKVRHDDNWIIKH